MNLVVVDRDGVINEDSSEFIKSPDEWIPIAGSLEAITRLNRSGHRVVVATNQSGVGRRVLTIEMLQRIHGEMLRQLAEMGGSIEAIFFCPHTPRDGCACRKPRPGLLLELSDRLRTPLAGVPVVGDRPRDVIAAREAGAQPILVRTGHGAGAEDAGDLPAGIPVFDNLAAFVDHYLAAARPGCE